MATHIPRKRFGQNFLVDTQVIRAIIEAIAPQKDDALIEIGPGLGALTAPLLSRVNHLHAIEIDRDISARLNKTFSPQHFSLLTADVLTVDFSALAHEKKQSLRVLGNLPYNISTPLLFHLADHSDVLIDLHFMLQKEVVERLAAAPESHEFGRLSVMMQYRFMVIPLFEVPPEAFSPAPKVDSAVVRLIPRPSTARLAHDEYLFSKIVTAAFSQRRKMLRNTLKTWLPRESDFAAVSLSPERRAETLSVDDYVRLSNAIHAKA